MSRRTTRSGENTTYISDHQLVLGDEQRAGVRPPARARRRVDSVPGAVRVVLDHDDLTVWGLFEAGKDQGSVGRVGLDPRGVRADVDLGVDFEGGCAG